MFNASWIASNSQTLQLSSIKQSKKHLENYLKLPLIPQKSYYLPSEQHQVKMQQYNQQNKNSLSFQEIFEIDQKNQILLKELKNIVNDDHNYKYQDYQSYIQNQQEYQIKINPYRIRHPSVDINTISDRIHEDVERPQQFRKITHRYKMSQLQNYCQTEKINRVADDYENDVRDSIIQQQDSIISSQSKQINNMKILNTKQSSVNQRKQKQTRNIKYNLSSINESFQQSKLKFKIVSQAVFAAMCLSKKTRQMKAKQQELRNQMNQKYQEYQKVIDKFSKRQAVIHEKLYYECVVEKVMHYFKGQQFIDETKNIQNQSKEYQSDIRKLNAYKFTTLLFQNVELYTRQDTIKDLIKGLINNNLHQKNQIPISKFVGQRCHFYNDDHLKIPKDQLVLIGLEYYFFCKLIPRLFDILNLLEDDQFMTKQKIKTNPFHLNECYFYVCIVATLIQQKMIEFFSKMMQIKDPNGNIVEKTLNLTEQQNLVVKAQITINSLSDNKTQDNQIVKGLINSDLILTLEQEKKQWKNLINQTFQQIVNNFQDLISN